jgi:HEAT repeat protein
MANVQIRAFVPVMIVAIRLLSASHAVAGQRTSAALLSEHEIEVLDTMAPQSQAELLLERAINRFRGAKEQIAARADGWRGHIKSTPRLENLFRIAINSDDMQVRAAGIDVNVAARNLIRSPATLDRLEPLARTGAQGPRANALWDVGLLGNRGVQPERAFDILIGSLHDPNENIRYWAVEGLAHLGASEIIPPLLAVFHDDPSPMIRERAACSLAQSGMLNESQRWTAVPRLLDFSEDYSLDAQTRGWVFQALRDITGQTLPPNPGAWRHWYNYSRK